jgi:hypothetical protein
MKVAGRFLLAELVWTAGIFVLMVPVALLDNDPPSTAHIIRWLGRAVGLAAFPAGISIAPIVFADARVWRSLLLGLAAASAVSLAKFVLIAVIPPLVSDDARTIPELLAVMRTAGESWEARNAAAWSFYTGLFAPLDALLFAAIGVQVGVWARYSLPPSLRRALYWAVGLGLLISGYAVWDTTYEAVVIRTAGDVSFAAFYTVLIPASICAGLALPTLALVRRDELLRNRS